MLLYIIRHGEPDYQNDTITELGHRQAKALAEVMYKRGVDEIYTSPQGRAKDTMAYTAELLKKGYMVEEWAREVWPDLFFEKERDGYSGSAFDIAGEFYKGEKFTNDYANWDKDVLFHDGRGKGCYDMIQENSDRFFERFGYVREGGLYKCEKPCLKKVAMFCHNGFGLTWLSQLLNIPAPLVWSNFYLSPTSVTTILFEQRSEHIASPRCIGLNDITHLYNVGLPMSRMGIEDKSGQEF